MQGLTITGIKNAMLLLVSPLAVLLPVLRWH